MKKKFKDRAIPRVVGSLLKGALMDVSTPIIASVTGAVIGATAEIKAIKEKNLEDKTGGHGKPNYIRYVGIAFGLMISLYFAGVISEDQVSFVMSLFQEK